MLSVFGELVVKFIISVTILVAAVLLYNGTLSSKELFGKERPQTVSWTIECVNASLSKQCKCETNSTTTTPATTPEVPADAGEEN